MWYARIFLRDAWYFSQPKGFEGAREDTRNQQIDFMHDDVMRPKGSMVVAVTLKSKMAAGSTSSKGNSKSKRSMIYLRAQTNGPSR